MIMCTNIKILITSATKFLSDHIINLIEKFPGFVKESVDHYVGWATWGTLNFFKNVDSFKPDLLIVIEPMYLSDADFINLLTIVDNPDHTINSISIGMNNNLVRVDILSYNTKLAILDFTTSL